MVSWSVILRNLQGKKDILESFGCPILMPRTVDRSIRRKYYPGIPSIARAHTSDDTGSVRHRKQGAARKVREILRDA